MIHRQGIQIAHNFRIMIDFFYSVTFILRLYTFDNSSVQATSFNFFLDYRLSFNGQSN